MFAHVPIGDDVHGGVATLLRLGPLLPVVLAGLVVALTRIRSAISTRRAGCVVTSAVAGAIHLALVPVHFAESPTVGVLFAAAGVTQLALAVGVAVSPKRAWWPHLYTAVALVVAVTFAAARTVKLPMFGPPEPLDALGLVTTALAVAAALYWWPIGQVTRCVRDDRFGPAVLIVGAVLAPIVFGITPSYNPTLQNAAVVGAVACALALFAGTEHRLMWWLVADAAVVGMVIRGPVIGFAVLGGALGATHALKAARGWWWFPPAATSLAVSLSIPLLDLRLDLLHVGHPDDITAASGLFVLAGLISLTAVAGRRLAGITAVYGALIAIELCRFWQGATGTGAIEVFVTSLTLFILVSPAFLTETRVDAQPSALIVGVAVGVSIGLARLVGVAYPIPWGVLLGSLAAAFVTLARVRLRPAAHVQTGHASPATPHETRSHPSGR